MTTYTLQQSGNIDLETTKVDGTTKRTADPSYRHGRLETRAVTTTRLLGTDRSETSQSFEYSGVGDETERRGVTTVTDADLPYKVKKEETTGTGYDPAGKTKKVKTDSTTSAEDTTPPIDSVEKHEEVSYVYDASGQLIARTQGDKTTLFFYWAGSATVAERTNGAGDTRARFLVTSSGEPLAEERHAGGGTSTWVWLLKSPDGDVATEVGAAGKVLAQRAYDPYGRPEKGGTSKAGDHELSSLGYQTATTDEATGRILLGPRQYDPETQRFTSADFYVGSAADMALGTDPLTGNRYLFAAANPVAFYEDGHRVEKGGGSGGFSYYRARHEAAKFATASLLRLQTKVTRYTDALEALGHQAQPGWSLPTRPAFSNITEEVLKVESGGGGVEYYSTVGKLPPVPAKEPAEEPVQVPAGRPGLDAKKVATAIGSGLLIGTYYLLKAGGCVTTGVCVP